MIEEGIVVDYKADKTLVKVEKDSACKGCVSIGVCKPASDETGMIVIVENTLHARKGDRVLITVGTKDLLKLSLMIYIFPLISFIVGILLGEMFGEAIIPWIDRDILAAVMGIIMLLTAFVMTRGYGKKWEREEGHLPKISRIVKRIK